METIEEAAKKCIIEHPGNTGSIFLDKATDAGFIQGAKFGANWQKEQLINEFIEAFKVEGIHYTKEFLLKLLEQNK